MTRYDFAFVACRAIALYLFVQVMVAVGNTVLYLVALVAIVFSAGIHFEEFTPLFGGLAPILVYGGVGAWVWRKSNSLASRMVGGGVSVGPANERAQGDESQTKAAEQIEAPVAPPILASVARAGVEAGLDTQSLMTIGFAIAGVFVFSQGFQSLFGVLYGVVTRIRATGTLNSFDTERMVSGVVMCLLGLWLLLGSSGVIKMIKSLRKDYSDGPRETATVPVDPPVE